MKLTRQNFIDYVFQPYNAAVKRGEYNKIGYEDWRKLRGWAYDESWSTHDMEIKEQCGDYLVGLWHNLRVCPVPFYFSADDGAFGSWIRDHRMEVILWDKDVRAIIDQPVSYSCLSSCAGTLQNSSNSVVGYGCDSNAEYSVHISTDKTYFDGQTLEEKINECIEKANKEKENNNMKFGNFDFGPVDSSVRMSMYGMAIKNASGTYVAYDKATDSIVDVDIFNFEGANKLIYKMPVAIADVKAGDIVIHARKPMFVLSTDETNRLCVLDIFDGEEKNIVLPKSMFGFDFVTKVVSLVDFTGSASASNPFGNMLPLLMMGDSKSEDILPLLFMMNGQANFAQNPMLMYAMMSKEGKMNDILPLMLICGSQSAPSGCNGTCAGHCKHK